MTVKAEMKRLEEGGFRITLELSWITYARPTHVELTLRRIYKDYQFLDEQAVNAKAGTVASKVAFSPNPDLYFDYLLGMGWTPDLPGGGPNDY